MQKYRKLIRELMIAVNVIDGIYANIARKMGIKENTLALMYALDDGKAHSQIEISREWMIPKTTLNTIVKECVQDGYVELSVVEHSKEKSIRLTAQGRKFAGTILKPLYQIEEEAFAETLQRYPAGFVEALTGFTECYNKRAGI